MKKPYVNNTKHIQHIGPITVMPGQMREIEEMHIQAHTGAANAPEEIAPEENPMALFLKAKVKTIKENLGDLSSEELDAVEALESAEEKPRPGVINAITEERLKRAAAEQASEVETFIASLDGMSDEELTEQRELYTDEPDSQAYLDAVNTEIENRAQQND